MHVFDRQTDAFDRLTVERCGFGYRDSVFKRAPDRRIVTAIELRLPRAGATNLSYGGLAEELAAMGGLESTPRNVAAAVRRIRRRKLPDPAVAGNAGSFFKNPVVTRAVAVELQSRFERMPVFPTATDAERKLSAAWLIEQAGWRGFRDGDAAVSAQHALVLVNLGRATGPQLLALARRVATSVLDKFGVALEPEPRIVGATFQACPAGQLPQACRVTRRRCSACSQGSAGASAAPFCSSSIEMLSGERTKAMRPSRGGRLIVTPCSMSRWQVA